MGSMNTEVADPLAGYAGFAAALREAGVACDARRVQAYLSAVAKVDVARPTQLYWVGRLTLCSDPDDLPRYEEAFARWFEGDDSPKAASGTPVRKQARIAPLIAAAGDGDGTEESHDSLRVAASDHEVLRHRDLAELTKAERAHLRELLATLRPVLPRRRAARRTPAHRGALDPARTLRAMLASGASRFGWRIVGGDAGAESRVADRCFRFDESVCRRVAAVRARRRAGRADVGRGVYAGYADDASVSAASAA